MGRKSRALSILTLFFPTPKLGVGWGQAMLVLHPRVSPTFLYLTLVLPQGLEDWAGKAGTLAWRKTLKIGGRPGLILCHPLYTLCIPPWCPLWSTDHKSSKCPEEPLLAPARPQ